MKHATAMALVFLLGVGWSADVHAWGSANARAIVSTAARLAEREGVMSLGALRDETQKGGAIGDRELAGRFPGFDQDPANAVEMQMVLLQSVKGERIDPYFAYRLGILGSMVARASAPLFGAPPSLQQQYNEDVAGVIDRISLQSAPRRPMDPRTYFAELHRERSTRREVIVKEYVEGLGFDGLARSALPEDLTRSVSAVVDTWNTVLSTGATTANVSQAQMHDYIRGSVSFYLDHGNPDRAYSQYESLLRPNVATANLRKEVGDLFFEAGAYDHALMEYGMVLEAEPGRRDVAERVAAYHMQTGEQALSGNALERAREAFSAALEANRLHPTAQARLLDVDEMIARRDAREAAARRNIEDGQELLAEAERLIVAREFAPAGRKLSEAAYLYEQVDDEFPEEARRATTALREIAMRRRDLQEQIISNAQMLSGAATRWDARGYAGEAGQFSDQGFQEMLRHNFEEQIRRLRDE